MTELKELEVEVTNLKLKDSNNNEEFVKESEDDVEDVDREKQEPSFGRRDIGTQCNTSDLSLCNAGPLCAMCWNRDCALHYY